MIWNNYIKGFKAYLRLEKSLSINSIEAYVHDVEKLSQYLEIKLLKYKPEQIELKHLQDFLKWLNEIGVGARTQSRIISGIKSFYKYLLLEDIVQHDPTGLIESPKIGRKLPDTLSLEEINRLIAAIDLSKPEGQRNKAMLETLYGCGLRVSELTNLKISGLYFDAGFIKITGKGDKERLVPFGSVAQKNVKIYFEEIRININIKKGNEDILFLNKRGCKLSMVMVFIIIKDLAEKIGLNKNISPHTFRHSFASHLVDRGDLTASQQWLALNQVIENNDYLRSRRGQFAERNADRSNWSHIVDLKFAQEFGLNFGGTKIHRFEFTFDIFNFTNLVNQDWGVRAFAGNNQVRLLDFRGFEADGTTPTFTFSPGAEENANLIDDSGLNSSRWQAQAGIRYTF